jgi:integrase
LGDKSFTLRNTKNSLTVILPLNDVLFEIVSSRLDSGSEYIFPARNLDSPIGRPAKALKTMVRECEFHFTPHDLRRTFRSVAASLSIPFKTAATLINHQISGALTLDASYIQTTHEELLRASNRIADEINRQACSSKSANVVSLKARASTEIKQVNHVNAKQ